MHVDAKAIVNPLAQGARRELRILGAKGGHKRHHRVVELVRAVGPAFSGDQPRNASRLERRLRLIERRARKPKRLGRPRDGRALDVHPAKHFVFHLQEIAAVEEVVRAKQRILHDLRTRMEGAVGPQGVDFGIAAWRTRHRKYNYVSLLHSWSSLMTGTIGLSPLLGYISPATAEPSGEGSREAG